MTRSYTEMRKSLSLRGHLCECVCDVSALITEQQKNAIGSGTVYIPLLNIVTSHGKIITVIIITEI